MKYKKVPSVSELIKQASLSEARNMSALPAMRFISNVTPSRRNVSNGRRKVQRFEDKKSVGEIDWNSFAPSAGRIRGIDMLSKKESYFEVVEPIVETFITVWKTDNVGVSASNQITLPLMSSGVHDFTVDWGDGTSDEITSYNQPEVTHTYSVAGEYEVIIDGDCSGFRFNNEGDKLKILEIKNFGVDHIADLLVAYRGCSNLTITATDILNLATYGNQWTFAFLGCVEITTISSIESWDTSNVTIMSGVFNGCVNMNQPLDNLNVSNVKLLDYMFANCFVFNQPLNSWDTSNATSMQAAFFRCSIFNQPLDNWDTSNVTNMSQMFWGSGSPQPMKFDQSLASWNITSVTNMTNMFLGMALSTENYDETLISWASQAVKSNVPFHGGNSKYTAGGAAEAARNTLIETYGWTITDGGAA